MSKVVLKTENLGISFGGLKAVQNLNLEIKEKQLYGLVGPNGAGKTTVFNMITGVYKPTTGKFWLDGEDLTGKGQETINKKGIARTFQNIRLFNNMTVIRNVMVGLHNQPEFNCGVVASILRLPKHFKTERAMRERAKEILDIVGLSGRENAYPNTLSGGQQQRVAIARALFNKPMLILADEPTGNLDCENSAEILRLLKTMNEVHGITILVVTHSDAVANEAKRVIQMSDGKVISDRRK